MFTVRQPIPEPVGWAAANYQLFFLSLIRFNCSESNCLFEMVIMNDLE